MVVSCHMSIFGPGVTDSYRLAATVRSRASSLVQDKARRKQHHRGLPGHTGCRVRVNRIG